MNIRDLKMNCRPNIKYIFEMLGKEIGLPLNVCSVRILGDELHVFFEVSSMYGISLFKLNELLEKVDLWMKYGDISIVPTDENDTFMLRIERFEPLEVKKVINVPYTPEVFCYFSEMRSE